MTNGLNNNRVKFLTYLVYVLLTLLTAVSIYHFTEITTLPETYVRLERYICDMAKIEKQLDRIIDKLDK